MHTPTLTPPIAIRLACPYGYFELACAQDPPAQLRWGCPAAERYADACRGLRLRYETLAPARRKGPGPGDAHSGIQIELRAADDPRGTPAGAGTHVCLAEPGRWLSLGSGALAIDDGEQRTVVAWEAGPTTVTWFARADLSLYDAPDTGAPPAGPHHVLVLGRLAPDARRPCADMPRERAIYAEWHAIQCTTDPAEVVDALDAPDPEGWQRLALLHRLARLGATDAVRRIAESTPADVPPSRRADASLLAFAARSILAGTSSVALPPTLDGLPTPAPQIPTDEAQRS